MARHRAPEPAGIRDGTTWGKTLPRRMPGTALPADLAPEPRSPEEIPSTELLARVRDGLARLDPWEGLLR